MTTLVYHDGSGNILMTLRAVAPGLPVPAGNHIEIDGDLDRTDLYQVVEGALVARADIVDQLRAEAIGKVNAISGEVRGRYVTVIAAQDMIYLQKEAEAKAYLADPAPIAADYPFITAEIGITGTTAYEVAQIYVNQAVLLRAVAAQLETARLGTIKALEEATSSAAIEAAVTGFVAALGGLAS